MMNEKLRKLIEEKAAKNAGTRLMTAEVIDPSKIERIPTGVTAIDAIMHGGIGRGDMTIICGPTHTGKTTLGAQIICKSVSMKPDEPFVIYSGEQQAGELKWSILQHLAGSEMVKTGVGEYGIPDATKDAIERATWNQLLWIDAKDANGKPLPQGERWTHLRKELETYAEAGVTRFYIDNLMMLGTEILGSREVKLQSDLERQTYIGTWLEGFAKQYNVWVILVAHFKKADGQDSYMTGPDKILGASSVPNSAGFIIEYNWYSDREIWGDPKNPDKFPGDPSLEYSRKVKIWKNRGYGTRQTRGIRAEFDVKSARIYTDYDDKADKSYPWRKRFDDPEWHDYKADETDCLPFV